MSIDQSTFQFELNESLYFERGQEVSEMISIALDPEISIQPFNEYVSIRGVIELRGEYQKVKSVSEEDDNILNLDDHYSQRYLEKIEDKEDGRTIFSHRFPVEISVPTYRIADINDITVSVESFDYEIPEENQLKLKSIIEIQGINEKAEYKSNTITTEDRVESDTSEKIIDEKFDFDLKIQEEENENIDEVVNMASSELGSNRTEVINLEEVVEAEIVDEVTDSEKDRWHLKKTQTFDEFFKEKTVPEVSDEADEEIEAKEKITIDDTEIPNDQTVEEQELNEETVQEDQQDSAIIENVTYLSDMFRNKDEETPQYTKVRICIVQQQDTITSIAERYKVPESQIRNQNQLDDNGISEGQLLSIPYN